MATTIMDRTRFSSSFQENLADIRCFRAHVINKLICELHILPPALEDAIIQRCPSHMSFSKSCSVKCLKGLVIICNLNNMKPRSISVDITHMWNESDRHVSLLVELSKCQSIDWIWIAPEDNKQLKQCLLQLRLGQADCIQNVKIKKSESIREIAARDLRFGDELRGLHLQGFDKIQESSVYDLCKMVDSLDQLNAFSLWYRYDNTLTKDGIDKLEAYLMQKQDEMILMYGSTRLPDGEDK
ncbi:hypothetical protein CAPTEDRAFT_191439 [Capitella teleta]|uniref:Uncharacterized protein n=1 Tax=Capitella teleta TaxID=283909 RepID=R7VB45_CAPTE|nr:hypothetical protein CAPTEDRAFT_191439 [Capitella teleta]|eukprot:ELU15839.1 hypothetical protein CAPTEDRAFT_191439 [Capitella teleta]